MKQRSITLIQFDDGLWTAETPKTKGSGKTASAALRKLADNLESKGARKDPQQQTQETRELADKIRRAAASGDPFELFKSALR